MTEISKDLDAELMKLDASSGFNIFEAAGLVNQEIRHSHFIAHIMSPSEAHELGTLGTSALLRELFGASHAVGDSDRIKVFREIDHIDLRILNCTAKRVYVIENKIWAGERDNQLERYEQLTRASFPAWERHYILLSPDGTKASHSDYRAVSYTKVVSALQSLLESKTLKPDVRLVVSHYVDLLERHVLRTTMISKQCEKIWHKHKLELNEILGDEPDNANLASEFSRAYDLLCSHHPDQRRANANLAAELRDLIHEDVPLDLENAFTSIAYASFRPQEWSNISQQLLRHGWTGFAQFPLFFEFDARGNRLALNLHIAKAEGLPSELREAAFATFLRYGFDGLAPALNEGSTRIFQREIHAPSDSDSMNWIDVEAHARNQVRKFVHDDYPRLRRAIESISWPRRGCGS